MFSHNGGFLSLALLSGGDHGRTALLWEGAVPPPPAMKALSHGKPLNPGVGTFTPPPHRGRLSQPGETGTPGASLAATPGAR